MLEFAPASLPEIDDVDIVDLRGLSPSRVDEYMALARTSHAFAWRVPHNVGQEIATWFRRLRIGEQARCHIPSYGVRFFADSQLVLEASLCWECNNAFGSIGTSELSFSFDAESPEARALLSLVKRSLPARALSRGR
jgi:hypothetical protein